MFTQGVSKVCVLDEDKDRIIYIYNIMMVTVTPYCETVCHVVHVCVCVCVCVRSSLHYLHEIVTLLNLTLFIYNFYT